MKEYDNHLGSNSGHRNEPTLLRAYRNYKDMYRVPGAEVPDDAAARRYLERYFLADEAYHGRWREMQESIFDMRKRLPEMIFKPDFEFVTLLGGVTFEQADFEQLMACLKHLGDEHLLLIEDMFDVPMERLDTQLKFKFPTDSTWEDVMRGDYISVALFEASQANYYVFGDQGGWGMYVATEYIDRSAETPAMAIRMLGFNPAYSAIFRSAFRIPVGTYCEDLCDIDTDERPDLLNWTPPLYRS